MLGILNDQRKQVETPQYNAEQERCVDAMVGFVVEMLRATDGEGVLPYRSLVQRFNKRARKLWPSLELYQVIEREPRLFLYNDPKRVRRVVGLMSAVDAYLKQGIAYQKVIEAFLG